jgi:hypothetical protein
MDVSKELNEVSSKKSFLKHVFDVDDESQKEMMNIVQYSLIALIPVLLLNKSVQLLFPEADESKNNIELLMEIAGQTVVMFLGMLFIHRLVTYVPTYSKVDYTPIKVTNVVIAFLTIVLSIQSRIGEKANILYDRVVSYLRPMTKEQPQVYNTTHGNTQIPTSMPLPSYANNGGENTAIVNQHSSNPQYNQPVSPNQPPSLQSSQNFGLLGSDQDEIMAANDGGMMWGSSF